MMGQAMFQTLRNIFAKPAAAPAASLPAGQRVYAVGDVTQRLALTREFLKAAGRSPDALELSGAAIVQN